MSMTDTNPPTVISVSPLWNEICEALEIAEMQLRAAQRAVDELNGQKKLLLRLMQPQPEILEGEDIQETNQKEESNE